VPTPLPLAEVVRDFLDGAGNIRGHFTANGDGVVVTGNLRGTYRVNPDCTGTISLDGVNTSVLSCSVMVACAWYKLTYGS